MGLWNGEEPKKYNFRFFWVRFPPFRYSGGKHLRTKSASFRMIFSKNFFLKTCTDAKIYLMSIGRKKIIGRRARLATMHDSCCFNVYKTHMPLPPSSGKFSRTTNVVLLSKTLLF